MQFLPEKEIWLPVCGGKVPADTYQAVTASQEGPALTITITGRNILY